MVERIRLSTNSVGDIVVVKCAADSIEQARLAHEADVLSAIEHPNVIPMIERSPNELTLAFGGRIDLGHAQIAGPEELARIAVSVLSTIADVAELGWVHRSLSPAHCLLGERGRVSICSWGRARTVTGPDDPAVRRDVADAAAMLRLMGLEIDPSTRAVRRRIDALTEALDEIISSSPSPADAARTINALSERWAARASGTPTSIAELRARHGSASRSRPRTRRSGRATAPTATRAELAGQFGVLAIAAAALGVLLFLGSPEGWPTGIDAATSVVDIGMDVTRWLAIASSVHAIVVACVGIAAIATRRDALLTLQRQLAPVLARRVLAGVTGLGVVASAIGAGGTPGDAVAAGAAVHELVPDTAAAPSSVTIAPATTSEAIATSVPVTSTSQPPGSVPAPVPSALTGPADPTDPAVTATESPTWVINRGDHLWRVAERTVNGRLGHHASAADIEHYWRRLIEANRHVLADPPNPDLVFAGQVFELPPMN